MDKQQRADRRQSAAASSHASKQQETSSSNRFAKWSSGSKFNKFLNNIERSILGQRFGGGGGGNEQPPLTKSKSAATMTHPSTNSANNLPSSADEPSTSTHHRSAASQSDAKLDRVTSEQLQLGTGIRGQLATTISGKPTPASRNAGANGKTILNKYQQQIVSTNSNKNTNNSKQQPSAATSAKSSYSHNRLSIPPPHANDEAQNQNHRLLFGLPSSQTAQPTPTVSEHNSTTANDQMTIAAYEPHGARVANITKHNTPAADQQAAFFYHSAASPASSAQSLPVTRPGVVQNRSTRTNQTLDDEESGFATYQSRRLAANITPNNDRVTRSDSSSKPDNNMMFMQANQTNRFAMNSNNNFTQQQPFIHHTSLQSRLAAQQQTTSTNNTQQQQHFNIQVPISQSVMYNNNNQQHIQQQQQQQLVTTNRTVGDNRSHLYDSYGHLGPVLSSQRVPMQQHHLQPQQQQHYQPQAIYDGQIYANAPPKPRRYQYYDSNFASNPTIRVPQNYPPHTHNPNQQMTTTGGPLARQFSYEQAQAFSQQQQAAKFINGIQVPFKPQRQLPTVPPPVAALTKSKSSLDVADLSRFKQDRLQQQQQSVGGMLRVQPQNLIYGSTRMINQIESSTLQRNQNYHPQITITYQQQQQQQPPLPPPTNLQRSKSIGNLMPDYDFNQSQRQMALFSTNIHQQMQLQQQQQQRNLAPSYSKFLTASSASTNNLNYVGLNANNTSNLMQGARQAPSQMMQRPDINNVSLSGSSHQQQQNVPTQPMRLSYQGSVSGADGLSWSNKPQQHHSQSAVRNNGSCGDREPTKITNGASTSSGKIVRQSHHHGNNHGVLPPVEGTSNNGFVAQQSLDDKIRHLLIGDDSIHSSSSGVRGVNSTNTTNTNSDIKTTTEEATTREIASAWSSSQQQQSQLQTSRQTQLSQREAGAHHPIIPIAAGVSNSFADTQQNHQQLATAGGSAQPNNEQAAAIENSHINDPNMGNRHQRQYQVGVGPQMRQTGQRIAATGNLHSSNDSMSVNSQLIVDLTTPRVLAKTQTTLLPGTSNQPQFRQQESWSMNQLGLPTNYIDQFAMNNAQPTEHISNQGFGMDAAVVAPEAAVNFSAPYYYSDLKSEEQQRALMNIVQQKSLSPPPQLLSRSIDQSNTRLAPKSATMHASQARMLSESLAASQRRLQANTQLQQDSSKSTNNIPNVSSSSNINKNIDKLFESPLDPRLEQQSVGGRPLQSVQSMLALSGDRAVNEDGCSAMSRVQSSDQNQIESLSNSSGYCSDAWKRAVSKSRSLENISQQQQSQAIDPSIDKSTAQDKLKRYGNPVYENIRRSDKLLSAINNSTTCLSTSSTRNRKARSCLKHVKLQPTSGSDSMDSILGSSFDDDDDDDEDDDTDETNPADIDSDTSATGIDFIKLSPTTADMSELIEQLKSNHAKLADEYKSTLARISKILNRKDSKGKRKVSEKLAGRLLRLENKSKKCESRSKNQLALIQMMEKAIRQTTKQESGSIDAINSSKLEVDKAPESSDQKTSPAANGDSTSNANTSPCNSIDYQNLRQSGSGEDQSQQHQTPPPPPPPVFEAQNVIKAIVTEATSAGVPKKFVAEFEPKKKQTKSATDPVVSLSTRHQQVKKQDSKPDSTPEQLTNGETVGQRIQSIESKVRHGNISKNPFKTDKPDSPCSPDKNKEQQQYKESRGAFYDDEDDFIEFLSTGSNSTHGRSQFESSQFSASDFNNSSTSGSTSESSHSGSVTTDSLDISSSKATTKNADGQQNKENTTTDKSSTKRRQSNRSNNNNNEDDDSVKAHKTGINKNEKATNKFKNVLGNVIDVDVAYPAMHDHHQVTSTTATATTTSPINKI